MKGGRHVWRAAVLPVALALLVTAVLAARPAAAATWDPYDEISGGGLTAPANGSAHECNSEVACTVSQATDDDLKTDYSACPPFAVVADTITYTWSATAGSWKNGVNTGRSVTWIAPASPSSSITITCTIADGGELPEGDDGSRDDDDLAPQVTVKAWKITELSVRRNGSGHGFASSATVAAGAKSSAEHKADVRIGITPAIAGVTVPGPTLVGTTGDGEVTNANVSGGGTTDSNGQVVNTAAHTSSDVIKDVTIEIVRSYTVPQATVTQTWNEDDNCWEYDEYFCYDEALPVTFKPRFEDTQWVAITGHTMNFIVPEADVWHWNESLEDYELLTYTNDPEDPNDWILAALCTFDPTSTGDSPAGSYTSDLTVAWDEDEIVDTVWFDAQDDGVYYGP
ncbi:MAG: hypothetical protein HY321_20695 [Armatimonadetes bacterium]|nr:hypothetical protein [Armatimonadota bacterium]